jgi:hypothetical protein
MRRLAKSLEDKDRRLTAATRELVVIKQQHGALLQRTAAAAAETATGPTATATDKPTATTSAASTDTGAGTATAPMSTASQTKPVTLESRISELEAGASGVHRERGESERAVEAARAELAALRTVHFELQVKADRCAKRLMAVHG